MARYSDYFRPASVFDGLVGRNYDTALVISLCKAVVSVGIVLASADFLEGSRTSAFYPILAFGL
jgi:hypothetical protein